MKGLLSASTYTGSCCIDLTFHIPLRRQFLAWIVSRFSLFTSDPFSLPHIQVSCRWSLVVSSFCLFIYGRASLAMEGKSVVPMEITFMDMEDKYQRYGTLRSAWYYRLVWAEPKTIATSAIFYLIKFLLYHFTIEPPCFDGTNRKLLKRAF